MNIEKMQNDLKAKKTRSNDSVKITYLTLRKDTCDKFGIDFAQTHADALNAIAMLCNDLKIEFSVINNSNAVLYLAMIYTVLKSRKVK